MPRTPTPASGSTNETTPTRIRRERRRLFSDRERQVFQLLRDGLPAADICSRLGVNRRAVRFAQSQLRSKFGCTNLDELRELAGSLAPTPLPVAAAPAQRSSHR